MTLGKKENIRDEEEKKVEKTEEETVFCVHSFTLNSVLLYDACYYFI